MKSIALFSAAAALVCGYLYRLSSQGLLLTFAISFGTTCYHFAMRLLVGVIIPNRFDPQAKWFQPKSFEAVLYRFLRVKHWKKHMPTYDPRLFSLQENTAEQIAANMCQAEVVHETIILCSFLPLLFSLVWGDFPIFLITSLAAALLDTLFVIMQRYNRPRILRLMTKKHLEVQQ